MAGEVASEFDPDSETHTSGYQWQSILIRNKVKLATVVEGDLKAPFQ